MSELRQLYKWFMQEWATTFFIGGVFALVFTDAKILGYFLAGAIVRRALFD